jgi:hypothetical protein
VLKPAGAGTGVNKMFLESLDTPVFVNMWKVEQK